MRNTLTLARWSCLAILIAGCSSPTNTSTPGDASTDVASSTDAPSGDVNTSAACEPLLAYGRRCGRPTCELDNARSSCAVSRPELIAASATCLATAPCPGDAAASDKDRCLTAALGTLQPTDATRRLATLVCQRCPAVGDTTTPAACEAGFFMDTGIGRGLPALNDATIATIQQCVERVMADDAGMLCRVAVAQCFFAPLQAIGDACRM